MRGTGWHDGEVPTPPERRILVLERPRRGIKASGYHTGTRTEFLVQMGSTLEKELRPSLLPRIRAIRDELWASGGIENAGAVLLLTRNQVFHSTSSAAAFVLGVSANGIHNWVEPPR